jgi:hypothetical protein
MRGRITKVMPYGAFVQLAEDVEGLVPISETAARDIDPQDQVIRPDSEVWVQILDLDRPRRRITLSITQAAQDVPIINAEGRQRLGDASSPSLPGTSPRSTIEVDNALRAAWSATQCQLILDEWEALLHRMHPKLGKDARSALAELTGLDRNEVDLAHQVRNRIAHNERDQVSETDLRRSAWLVGEALQRLEASRRQPK